MKFVVIFAEGEDASIGAVGGQVLAALAQRGFGGAPLPEPSPERVALPASLMVPTRPKPQPQPDAPRSKYVDLIGRQLAAGSLRLRDLGTALKANAGSFRSVLKNSPYFEQENPNNRLSAWRLSAAGRERYMTGKA
jgi:hypothetical protein